MKGLNVTIFKQIQRILLVGTTALFFVYLSPHTAFASTELTQVKHAQQANAGVSTSLSENWSGYEANSGTNYTNVTGTWIVPASTASTSFAADATWVGIGGASGGSDLIQAGTQAIIQNGVPTYQAWYELLPDISVPLSLPVQAGDSITATITQIPQNLWVISIADNTTGQKYVTTVNYTSSLSSAEWIQEMPSDPSGVIPLDNFGSVSFTNASTIVNGYLENLTQANAKAVTLVSQVGSNNVLAYPSAVGTDGASFTVFRKDSSYIPESSRARKDFEGFMPDPSQLIPGSQILPSFFFIQPPVTQDASSSEHTQTFSSGGYTVQITTYTQQF